MKKFTIIILSLLATGFFAYAPVFSYAVEENTGGVKGLEDRLQRIEEAMKQKGLMDQLVNRLTLSGVIEVEANYTKNDEKATDIDLAKVELGIDADVSEHVNGTIVLLWEGDGVDVDEAMITFDGANGMPFYLNTGRFVIPFGYYESHFITDPLTLELGETNEGALVGGFANDMFDFSLGVFNSDIAKKNEDDNIESFVASAKFNFPNVMFGASYISNLAGGSLGDEINVPIQDYIAGYSAFVSFPIIGKVFFEAEYVAAVDHFEMGELSFDSGTEELKPKAWNMEVALEVTEDLEIGVRFEGSDDCVDFLPEMQYGVIVSYGLFKNTGLAVEYLNGKFENDDKQDVITAQLSVEF